MRSTTDKPTYCQVVCPVAFHHDNQTFSPVASSVGGEGTSPQAGAGVALTALDLTKNATYSPNSATQMILRDGNFISNIASPM